MDPLPIEFSDDAFQWAESTLEVLQYQLENDLLAQDRSEANDGDPWNPPQNPEWVLLVFPWFERNLAELFQGPDSQNAKKMIVERFIGATAQWTRHAIQAARTRSERTEIDEWLLLVLAQKSAEIYFAIRAHKLIYVPGWLLQNVFLSGKSLAIRTGVDFLLQFPPSQWKDISLAISPLMQSQDWNIDDVFPKLLGSTNPSVLALLWISPITPIEFES